MLANRFASYSPVIRSDYPLSDDQIRRVAPSIFADALHERINQEQQQHNATERAELINDNENTAKGEVKRSVAAADRSLHVGHGRDVALEDGVYANEARAKIYMAGGRAAAGRIPELKNAAAVEAYIERKIKQKFPDDPVLLQRVMQTARNKISHAIAHGFDFSQPRVSAKTEIERARQNPDPNSRQNPQIEKEQNREHHRTHDRSR